MKNKTIVFAQLMLLFIIGIVIYLVYPRTLFEINGNVVRFDSMNAEVIILSENPDFSNPRYIDVNGNVSLNLKPGTYYWKASNGIIQGLKKEFIISSEVGLEIEKENGTELVNVGNVKVNVTKEDGVMVGHIILEPNESEEIEDRGEYTGRQNDK